MGDLAKLIFKVTLARLIAGILGMAIGMLFVIGILNAVNFIFEQIGVNYG